MTSEPTFADLGEDRIVARILARIPAADHVLIGPGDDAAVSVSPGRLVSTADMLVEGEDFLAGWLDPVRLGVKAAAQNLADVRAMGAHPTGLLLSLAAPGHTPASFVDGLLEGMVDEAARAGASVLGGDLSDAPQIVISVTALGSLPSDQVPYTRDAARAGFDVLLGGQTGWAAAGLDILLASGGAVPSGVSGDVTVSAADGAVSAADGAVSAADAPVSAGDAPVPAAEGTDAVARAVEAQRAPRPDYGSIDNLREAVGGHRAGDAHSAEALDCRAALIDLSDGLSSDAGRMARASAVVIDFDAAAIDALADDLVPVAAHVLRLTDDRGDHDRTDDREHDRDDHVAAARGAVDHVAVDRARALARRWVLTGGEDHGFLAAVPQGVDPIGWTRIGRVRPVATDAGSTGVPTVLIDGVPVDDAGFAAVDPDGGFRHFSGSGE